MIGHKPKLQLFETVTFNPHVQVILSDVLITVQHVDHAFILVHVVYPDPGYDTKGTSHD